MRQNIVMPFDGKVIEVVKDEQGGCWISIKSVCEAIGVATNPQREKISNDPRFSWNDIVATGSDGKQYRMFCLCLNQLNGWLFTINANKVAVAVRDNLLRYQQECFEVLKQHFMPRGEIDFVPFMGRLEGKIDAMILKVDYLTGMDLTVFGDDAPMIKELISEAAKMYNMSHPEVWGLIRKECDVSSYKLQNRKIINYLRNLLGTGLKMVEDSSIAKR